MESMLKVHSEGTSLYCTSTKQAESMHYLIACFNRTPVHSVLSKIVL